MNERKNGEWVRVSVSNRIKSHNEESVVVGVVVVVVISSPPAGVIFVLCVPSLTNDKFVMRNETLLRISMLFNPHTHTLSCIHTLNHWESSGSSSRWGKKELFKLFCSGWLTYTHTHTHEHSTSSSAFVITTTICAQTNTANEMNYNTNNNKKTAMTRVADANIFITPFSSFQRRRYLSFAAAQQCNTWKCRSMTQCSFATNTGWII